MMINRLTGGSGDPWDVPLDYWVVTSEVGTFLVSSIEAERISRLLEQAWPPRWIGFRELCGARIRIQSVQIMMVAECTAEQRARERRLRDRLKNEDDDREPWAV